MIDLAAVMRHVVVSRFSVPRLDTATARHHLDRDWLAQRLDLFRRYFVPSVGRCGVGVVLLCSTESAEPVATGTADLPWVEVVVQDDWYGGWHGAADQMVTRLDTADLVAAMTRLTEESKPATPSSREILPSQQKRHNLPPQATPFIGREAELAELDQLLANPEIRLMTIVSPGGMGKTRLALATAEQQATVSPVPR